MWIKFDNPNILGEWEYKMHPLDTNYCQIRGVVKNTQSFGYTHMHLRATDYLPKHLYIDNKKERYPDLIQFSVSSLKSDYSNTINTFFEGRCNVIPIQEKLNDDFKKDLANLLKGDRLIT